MGLFRFGLSAVVVLFHFGGLGPISGRVVVFTFFVLSGYLMALVLSGVYGSSARGAIAFYANRLLRLVPPFVLYAALTLILLDWRQGQGFLVDPLEPLWFSYSGGGFLDLGWSWTMQLDVWPPRIAGSFSIDPPTWSLVNEACFYLVAPLAALALRWNRPTFALVLLVSLTLPVASILDEKLEFDNVVYENVLGSAWTFFIGMAMFSARDPLRRALHPRLLRWAGPAGLLLGGIFLLQMVREASPPEEARMYAYLALSSVSILLLGLHERWPKWYLAIDRRVGDLAYGVFLGHFMAALILLGIAEEMTRSGREFNPFGRLNTREFGYWVLALTTVISLGVFRLVEEPVQKIRKRVRRNARGSEPETQPAPAPPPAMRPVEI